MSAVGLDSTDGIETIDALDDDPLVEVLRAAKSARILAGLATSNWKLCCLARSRLPLQLLLNDYEQVFRVTRSRVLSKAPFSGCTNLTMGLGSEALSDMTPRAMHIASQWTALRQLDLSIKQTAVYQLTFGPNPPLDSRLSLVLRNLPQLQQLQSVTLEVPAFGARCAGLVAQLGHLTALKVTVTGGAENTAAALFPDEAEEAAADLAALSRLTKLSKLTMYDPPAVQPAAAAACPFCLPSSLTYLYLGDREPNTSSSSSSSNNNSAGTTPPNVSPVAYWRTHLPGCPNLHHLEVVYGSKQHPSAHPSGLISMCAKHNRQLRTLKLRAHSLYANTTWEESLPGLPDAAGAMGEWHPDAALASLTGLECHHAADALHISTQADWEVLAQLTALKELGYAAIRCAPLHGAGVSLGLTGLESCMITLRGRDLGRLLLACPALKSASCDIVGPLSPAAEGPAGVPLGRHPSLEKLELTGCKVWGEPAAVQGYDAECAAAAAAEYGRLAGVLSGLSELSLWHWPCAANSHLVAADVLPDLSACTGLTGLHFVSRIYDSPVPLPQQEAFLSMVRPLSQLRSLHLVGAPHVNARTVGWLQHLLPQLTRVVLQMCGALPDATVAKRRQLLRRDLELVITDEVISH